MRRHFTWICVGIVPTILTGCASGRILDKTAVNPYAVIVSHAKAEDLVKPGMFNGYPYTDISVITPLWNQSGRVVVKGSQDIYVTDGWFSIEYTCANTITTDYGNETVIHVHAGHKYEMQCHGRLYGSLTDLGALAHLDSP